MKRDGIEVSGHIGTWYVIAEGTMKGVEVMELKNDWADKVIEEAEGMGSMERSTYVQKKLAELVERIALLDCLEQTEDVKNTIRTAERLFDQLFEYVNA